MISVFRTFAEAEMGGGIVRVLHRSRRRFEPPPPNPPTDIRRPCWIRVEIRGMRYDCEELRDLHLVAEDEKLDLALEIGRQPKAFAGVVNAVIHSGTGRLVGSKRFGPQEVALVSSRLGIEPSQTEARVEEGQLIFLAEVMTEYRKEDHVYELREIRTAIDTFACVSKTLGTRIGINP